MEFIREVLGIVSQYYSYLLSGVGYTMLIALIGTAAGFLIGLLTGVIRTAPKSKNAVLRALHKIVNAIIAVYIEVFRGTPMMVQAMVIYWGYAFLNDGATLPLIPAGLFIVSINTGAYMAEIVRGGIISVDRGQLEGAYSVGMTHAQAMVKVVIPQVLQNILPSISNEFVINIKDTSVLNVIGVTELYYMAGVIKLLCLFPAGVGLAITRESGHVHLGQKAHSLQHFRHAFPLSLSLILQPGRAAGRFFLRLWLIFIERPASGVALQLLDCRGDRLSAPLRHRHHLQNGQKERASEESP